MITIVSFFLLVYVNFYLIMLQILGIYVLLHRMLYSILFDNLSFPLFVFVQTVVQKGTLHNQQQINKTRETTFLYEKANRRRRRPTGERTGVWCCNDIIESLQYARDHRILGETTKHVERFPPLEALGRKPQYARSLVRHTPSVGFVLSSSVSCRRCI